MTLDEVVRQVVEWDRATFPDQAVWGKVSHLSKEMVELANASSGEEVAEELADVFMLLVCIAADLKVNLAEAVEAKLAINKARKWKPSADGSVEHER